MFFFEKKNQKTFTPWRGSSELARAPGPKSFLLLFLKKEALSLFLIACFALPTEAAFSFIFYLAVIPAVLVQRDVRLAWPVWALILWSGLTLLWGEGDARRVGAFALGAVCTLLFMAALRQALRDPAALRRLGTLLIWAGAVNALWSMVRGLVLHTIAPQLLGWGITHHPILGASVMAAALLTALARALAETRGRWLHAAACLVMAAFILLTESRGPLLACTLAALVIVLGGPWRRQAGLVMMTGCVLLTREPAAWRQHQLGVLLDRGDHHRFEAWSRTLALIRQRPLFGHGLAANLDLPGITFPHDLYLGVLFYSGLAGGCLFAALALTVTARLCRMPPGADRLWLGALWVNALVAGLTDLGQITKGPGALWLIVWLPVGMILGYPIRMSPEPCSDSQAHASVR
jgi:O-antigen ligase